jgi:hypothetical protein
MCECSRQSRRKGNSCDSRGSRGLLLAHAPKPLSEAATGVALLVACLLPVVSVAVPSEMRRTIRVDARLFCATRCERAPLVETPKARTGDVLDAQDEQIVASGSYDHFEHCRRATPVSL